MAGDKVETPGQWYERVERQRSEAMDRSKAATGKEGTAEYNKEQNGAFRQFREAQEQQRAGRPGSRKG